MTQDFQDFNEYAYEVEGAPEEETVTLATPGDRLLAFIVNVLIFMGIAILGLIVGVVLALVIGGSDELEAMTGDNFFGFAFLLIILPPLLIILGYWVFVLAMIAQDGQSPGKKVLKIRIITTDGSAWGWGGTLVREVLSKFLIIAVISGILGALMDRVLGPESSGLAGLIVNLALFIWIVMDENNQTLHDKITNTYVVKVS